MCVCVGVYVWVYGCVCVGIWVCVCVMQSQACINGNQCMCEKMNMHNKTPTFLHNVKPHTSLLSFPHDMHCPELCLKSKPALCADDVDAHNWIELFDEFFAAAQQVIKGTYMCMYA